MAAGWCSGVCPTYPAAASARPPPKRWRSSRTRPGPRAPGAQRQGGVASPPLVSACAGFGEVYTPGRSSGPNPKRRQHGLHHTCGRRRDQASPAHTKRRAEHHDEDCRGEKQVQLHTEILDPHAPSWRRLRTLHMAVGLVETWGATAEGCTPATAMRLQRLWSAMSAQTLRIHHRPGDARGSFVRRRAEQVQIYVDLQHRRSLGEQAVLNFATCVLPSCALQRRTRNTYMRTVRLPRGAKNVAQQSNTWTDRMAHYWMPDYDGTTRMLRARTTMKAHSIVAAKKNLYKYMVARAERE